MKEAEKTLKNVMKARRRGPVVGSRKVTKKQQNQILISYAKACRKHSK